MGNKIKSFNSQILHKVNLNDYELNRKKIFENYSKDGGLLVRKDITDEVVKEVGLGHLIQKKKKNYSLINNLKRLILNVLNYLRIKKFLMNLELYNSKLILLNNI